MSAKPALVALLILGTWFAATVQAGSKPAMCGGELRCLTPKGEQPITCPLKHTDVKADIAGFLARTTVRQTFQNPLDRKIEAVYVFPLPQDAAVDDMTMIVGDRRIIGSVRPRDEAREVYEQAKAAGHVASLLDQERPNIFTQAVANIEPGATVEIEISYVETLKYTDGTFEWVFPMVVGPRYIPGGGSAPAPMTTGTATAEVPDGNKITPPIAPEGKRAGHDISLTVNLNAGLDLFDMNSVQHEVGITSNGPQQATVTLNNKNEIPNKDFVLRYRLATDQIGEAFLTHADPRGQFFTLILQPPQRVTPQAVVPRELIFVLDTSGSMSGVPIESAKKAMNKAIDALLPGDTFNLITFSGDTNILWDKPHPASKENLKAAQKFLADRKGGGGTEMMKAIDAALAQSLDQPLRLTAIQLADLPADGRSVSIRVPASDLKVEVQPGITPGLIHIKAAGTLSISACAGRWANFEQMSRTTANEWLLDGRWVTQMGDRWFQIDAAQPLQAGESGGPIAPIRVVCFMTDGYVGNDMAIIDAVKKNAGTTRVFSFGIGRSVNRFLLDGMAAAGRGEVEYVLQDSEAEDAAKRFHERIQSPVLTDVRIDWGDMAVEEVYPATIPDLFSVKPILVHGRLRSNAGGTITVRGNTGAGPYERTLTLRSNSPAPDSNAALPSLWARAKVADLMIRDMAALQNGNFPAELKKQITALGVDYRMMTQFTSFVAVEQMTVTVGGQPTRVDVPVEMPADVSYEGVFGADREGGVMMSNSLMRTTSGGVAPAAAAPAGKKSGGGRSSGFSGGVTSKAPAKPTAPQEERKQIAGDKGERKAMDEDVVDGVSRDAERQQPPDPLLKLSEPLRALADKVARDGKDGNLTVGRVTVSNYRVDVMISFDNITPKVLEALEKLGFKQTGESKTTALLFGTIDVRKLEELAKLEAVMRVKAVVE